jgi:predicted nuclease with TOPRIM domain
VDLEVQELNNMRNAKKNLIKDNDTAAEDRLARLEKKMSILEISHDRLMENHRKLMARLEELENTPIDEFENEEDWDESDIIADEETED